MNDKIGTCLNKSVTLLDEKDVKIAELTMKLENTERSHFEQSNAMFEYIDALETAQIELKTILSKCHDDSLECNRAYNADDFCDFKKRNFYAMFAKKLANSEWIRYSKAVLKDSDQ